MGGGGTSTTSQTSSSASPAVTSTLNKLLGGGNGVQGLFDKGPTFTGAGDTTKNAWASSLAAANNPTLAAGLNGAVTNYSDIAAGNQLGANDPGYAALRSKLSNDVLTSTNSAFNNSGLFGSDSNQKAAASGLADSLGALDYGQYKDSQARMDNAATSVLPSLFAQLQAPSATAGAVGAAQDANAQGQANAGLTLAQQLSQILNGTSGAGGTTTTNTSPVAPWWAGALGLGASLL